LVIAAIGKTRTRPSRPTRSPRSRNTSTPSSAGRVFGMQQTVVKPPAAAAAVPVAIVSFASNPGSRR
jgi:hypothetical protein